MMNSFTFKICLFFVSVLITTGVSAQTTQSGYVKTKGRLDNNGALIPGKRLGSVSIILSNGNSTVSGDNGDFSLTIPDKKFYLKSVQKQGYILADPEVVAKQYVYSPNPFVITMETPAGQTKDQVEAQKKLEATLRKQLQQREKELEELKTSNRLSEEDYYQKLQQLYDEKATEKLIKEMSKRYAEIDYDLIDSFQRQFSQYILNGDLQRADSLLKTKGNLSSDVSELQLIREANIIEQEKLKRRRLQLDSSMSYAQWLMEDIAMRCYHKSEIFQLQYRNDSAAYYLELRAGLDTTNALWQLEAGFSVEHFLFLYEKAMFYYQRALRNAIQKGDDIQGVAVAYNNIGDLYIIKGDYNNALAYFQKSLDLWQQSYSEEESNVATYYNNIGSVYSELGNYSEALSYYQKALEIWKRYYGENDPLIAKFYNNIGAAYNDLRDYNNALEYHRKALNILEEVYKDDTPELASSYNNIGVTYHNLNSYVKAMNYYEEALKIYKKLYGEKHPTNATFYNNIGKVWDDFGDYANKPEYYTNALSYYLKAINISKRIYGDNHIELATPYNNLGVIYNKLGNYVKALKNHQKALEIERLYYGENHPDIASSYNNIAEVYYDSGNYTKALEYYQKALDVIQKLSGNYDLAIAECYMNMGLSYYMLNDNENAIDYLQKFYNICKEYKEEIGTEGLKTISQMIKQLKKNKR